MHTWMRSLPTRIRQAPAALFIAGLVAAALLVYLSAADSAPFGPRRSASPGAARGGVVTKMPGTSYTGALSPLTERETKIRDLLRHELHALCVQIGERNTSRHDRLEMAAIYLEKSFINNGYKPLRQSFSAKGRSVRNIEVEIPGSDRANEIFIVGAHYDTVQGSPGANDNGTGTAALLTLSRHLTKAKPSRTLRFVAFVNEEQPYFQSELMGSMVYARRSKQRRENIVGMFSLETMGYYTDAPNSQHYPASYGRFYPATGNFIGFVGNVESAALVQQAVASFRKHAQFPSEGGALPGAVEGVGWSDHWSFWQQGYPAVEITDTAFFRYPHYHRASDTPDKIALDRFARVVAGLEHVVADMVGVPASE